MCRFFPLAWQAHATPDMPWDLQDDEFEGIIEGTPLILTYIDTKGLFYCPTQAHR
jgi:hypothetical protein